VPPLLALLESTVAQPAAVTMAVWVLGEIGGPAGAPAVGEEVGLRDHGTARLDDEAAKRKRKADGCPLACHRGFAPLGDVRRGWTCREKAGPASAAGAGRPALVVV